MTATQTIPRSSARSSLKLVCRPLISMAAKGFDKACLLQMQDAAFRYAAQSLQSNRSRSPEPDISLWEIVDQRLGGSGHAHADVSPGHIAAYTRAKALLGQFPQRYAMFDVTALLAAAPLSGPGAGPRNRWLAYTLVNLQRDSYRLSATAPTLASEIATLVSHFAGDRDLNQAICAEMERTGQLAAAYMFQVDEHRCLTHCCPMTIQNSTFGFIYYFIADKRQRVPCQFFLAGGELLARLDAGGAKPVLTAVSRQMHPEVLGSFSAILDHYKTESGQVLAAENFWRECEDDGAGALKLFQVVHHMRLFGASVSQGIDASIALRRTLRASETCAARAIYEIFSADLLRMGIDIVPGAHPAIAPRAASLASLY